MEGVSFRVVIPARFASTRLPGKPLADIGGKPMVVRVAEAARASGAAQVVVATDHEAVLDACRAVGVEAWMTRHDHASGTDRLAEVALRAAWDDDEIVVNVQGDEPLIDPALIREVAGTLACDTRAHIATAAHAIGQAREFFNPNVVKVVLDGAGRALYFSRAPIPYARDDFARSKDTLPAGFSALRHVGIYAYRVSFLKSYASLNPSPLEQFEALEQLRALAAGYAIAVKVCEHAPQAGVDTAEDLARVRAVVAGRS